MAFIGIDRDHLPHPRQFEALINQFKSLGRVLVAYSGGVDSTLLMKAGTLALGEGCLGVIAQSETLTGDEYSDAMALARAHGFNIETVHYSELEIENYAQNTPNRCYFCKRALFGKLQDLARERGAAALIDGTNADDVGDWRPGMKAAKELQVVSPLRDCGVTKAQIRDLARALGLPNWDKPSAPCLSSRVAYGITIDKEKLAQIAGGEKFLRENGFRVARVRHHDTIARIEVAPEEITRLMEPAMRAKVAARLKALGFQYVTVDLLGYRMGSLNESFLKDKGQIE